MTPGLRIQLFAESSPKDLSHCGQSLSREQWLHSILEPSAQPPQFQTWGVESKDGEAHRRLQLDHKAIGAIELLDPPWKNRAF